MIGTKYKDSMSSNEVDEVLILLLASCTFLCLLIETYIQIRTDSLLRHFGESSAAVLSG